MDAIEKESGKKKKPMLGCLFFLLLPLIIPMAISLPGMFGKDIEDADDISFDIINSKLYQQIEKTYQEFELDVQLSISNQIAAMQQADAQAMTNAVGMTINRTTEMIDVSAKQVMELSPDLINYALAYVMTKYEDIQTKTDSFLFRLKLKNEMNQFFQDITTIKVWREGVVPNIRYCSSVEVLDINTVSIKYFPKKPDQFLCSYESFQWITELEDSINGSNSGIENEPEKDTEIGNIKYPESGMKIPHFLQYDPKWAQHPYGNHNMAHSACGPTSMAMIISYLLGKAISPVELADWSMAHGYYVSGQGTSWAFYSGVAKAYGVKSQQITVSANSIMNQLKAGHPVITSMRPGTFTKGGHFIVLRGVTPEGRILVNDPNDNNNKNFFNKEFSISLIIDEAKAAWAFSK